jgi:hypothetical protein
MRLDVEYFGKCGAELLEVELLQYCRLTIVFPSRRAFLFVPRLHSISYFDTAASAKHKQTLLYKFMNNRMRN